MENQEMNLPEEELTPVEEIPIPQKDVKITQQVVFIVHPANLHNLFVLAKSFLQH